MLTQTATLAQTHIVITVERGYPSLKLISPVVDGVDWTEH